MGKFSKFIVFIVLISGLLILTSEIFQEYIFEFQADFKYIVYSSENEEDDDFVSFCEDLCAVCSENSVNVFTITKSFDENGDYVLDVYTDGSIDSYLEDKYDVKKGTYKSLISGTSHISVSSFDDMVNPSKEVVFYFYGSIDGIRIVHQSMNDKYGTSYIKSGYENYDKTILIGAWCVVMILLIALTCFDVECQKKETFVRISLGDSVSVIIVKNIITDLAVYTGLFLVIRLLLGQFIYVDYCRDLFFSFMIIMLVLNSLVYLTMLKYDVKKSLSKGNYSESFCGTCYIVKVFISIFAILSVSVNFLVIYQGVSFLSEKNIISEYSDYKVISLLPSAGTNNRTMEDYYSFIFEMYREKYDEYNVAYSVENIAGSCDCKYLTINMNASNVMGDLLSLHPINNDLKVHIFVPQKYKDEFAVDEAFAVEMSEFYGYICGDDYEVIYYDESETIMYFDMTEVISSAYADNPIVMYYTFTEDEMNVSASDIYLGRGERNVMFNMTDEQINSYIEETDINNKGYVVKVESVTTKYEQFRKMMLRLVLCNCVVSCMFILLDIMIISVILRLEYSVNAIELSVKKLMGYTVLKKNMPIINTVLYTGVIATTFLVVLVLMYNIAKPWMIISAGLLMIVTQVLALEINIAGIEKKNVSKILKGGAL